MMIVVFIISFFFSNMSFASDYSNFKNVSNTKAIKAFVKDLSFMTSSSLLYSARTLGFGGFDLSYKTSYLIKPSVSNTVFEKDKSYNISFVQVETGLPYRIDTFLRAGGNSGYNVVGGGVKYGLKKVSDEVYSLNSSISFYSHMGVYRDFYIVSFGTRLVFSLKLSNLIIPFVSGGFDNIKFRIKSHTDPLLESETIYDNIYRGSFGVRFKTGWFNIAASVEAFNNGSNMFGGSAGIRF